MTPDRLNRTLINAMKEKIPDGVNLANKLMDILSIGKEAVYRRFRGEVPFTLGEAMIISRELGVSLDKLTGFKDTNDGVLDLNLYNLKNPVDIYYSTIEHYINILRSASSDKKSEHWEATNRVPHVFCMNFDSLSQFHLFKWLYQQDDLTGNYPKRFEDVQIPAKLRENELEFLETIKMFDSSYYIWDNMIFKSLVNDIHYFKEINMIAPESMQQIKKDLLQLITDLEKLAACGHFLNGNKIQVLISDINFETSYSYIESEEDRMCFIQIYDLNIISSGNKNVFYSLKRWIQSLRKFSTIITQSAELQRYKFFEKQKEYVNSL